MIIIDYYNTLPAIGMSKKDRIRLKKQMKKFVQMVKESKVKLIVLPNPYDHPIL